MPFVNSSSHDPYTNAAVESLLFQRAIGAGPFLYVWTNDPCVVLGRHQNPWVECNMAALRAAAVPLVRRISGGGTVYHDRGNLNFSFMAGDEQYDLDAQFALLLGALGALGIDANRNERNDLVLGTRKFSGNAFRHSRGASLHHGTLLVEADLSHLTTFLAAASSEITTKAIASVRSTVVNLSEEKPVDTNEVIDALAAEFAAHYADSVRVGSSEPPSWFPSAAEISEEREHLGSWEWVFGHTPAFSRTYRDPDQALELSIHVRKGRIETAILEQAESRELLAQLEGQPLRRETVERLDNVDRFRKLRDTMMEDLW